MGRWNNIAEDKYFGGENTPDDPYPRRFLRVFYNINYEDINYDDNVPAVNNGPEWPRDEGEVAAEAAEAFAQRWGGISDEVFLRVLEQGRGRDRLAAIFALGYSSLPQAAELLVPFLGSAKLVERCAAAIMLGLRRDERALPVLEEYLLADVPLIQVNVPPPLLTLRHIQPEAEIWFVRYREWIAGVVASWGPASMTAVLRKAFLKYWEQEQKKQYPTYHLPDGLLYALGRRGALAALHGIALPDLHQRLAMIYLALGALHADERFDDHHNEMLINRELKQEVVIICMTHFGLAEQEAEQCVKSYGRDYRERQRGKRVGETA